MKSRSFEFSKKGFEEAKRYNPRKEVLSRVATAVITVSVYSAAVVTTPAFNTLINRSYGI